MSIDYLDKFEDAVNQDVKQKFLDYILHLEDDLEQAEIYGKAGDIRMLDMLGGFKDIKSKIAEQVEFANEPVPPEDYLENAFDVAEVYFSKVMEAEILRIQDGIAQEGVTDYWNTQINNLIYNISYFKEMFVNLDVDLLNQKASLLGK